MYLLYVLHRGTTMNDKGVNNKSKRRVLSNLLLASCVALIASTTQGARIEGRISDAQERVNFSDAIVRISELNRQVISGEDGRYSFTDIPQGEYTLVVDYIGADTVLLTVSVDSETTVQNVVIGADVEQIDNIIVYGLRGQTASALNKQRSADNVLSVISSDAAGTLPDENIAEALQRAPGVFISRDQGEGRFVGIRGLSPSLNNVSINGINVPSPDGDQRAVALDVIPSDLLETLEISKSFTPDQDGDAIGGSINVRSLSGFDRNGQFLRLSLENNYNELQSENSPKVAATYTNVFELNNGRELAVAGAVSYANRDFGSDNLEHDGGWVEYDNFTGVLYPEEPEIRDYVISRERIGYALNFDYLATDNTQLYLRTLLSDFEDDEIRNRIEIEPDQDEVIGIPTNLSADYAEAEYTRSLKDRVETQRIFSAVFGGETQVGLWNIDYSLGYSQSEEDDPNRVDTDFAGSDNFALSYRSLNDGTKPNYIFGQEVFDPTQFELDEIVVENNLVEDEEQSFKLDFARQMQFGSNPGEIKFGLKVRSREKERESEIRVYDDFDSLGNPTAETFATSGPDYDLNQFGFGLNPGRLRGTAFNSVGSANINNDETLVESTVGDFLIEEDVSAAYIMATINLESLRIVGGVRIEQTDFSSAGALGTVYESETFSLETAGFGNSSFDSDYDFVMPSLLARYEVSDNVILRSSISQTISRPSFSALNPSSLAEIEEEDGETEFAIEELGNSELDPFESLNFDIGLDFYPGNLDNLSAVLFYKDVDNFIAEADVSSTLDLSPWLSLVGLTTADITDVDARQFQNGDSATVLGLELAYIKNFENGFMFGINGTFTDSEADFEGRTLELPEAAETIANLSIGYENNTVSGRLALAYKSEQLLVIGGDKFEDVYQDAHTQLDMSVKYTINDNFQLYFDGINLTDEPFYAYQNKRRFNAQYEEYGRTFILGLNFTKF